MTGAEDLEVSPISNGMAKKFVAAHHYAVICPPITKISLGLLAGKNLVGVALWGYGTRPKHTIKRIFPSLDVKDYLELNRLCVLDSMPRNTESRFIRMMAGYVRECLPSVKLLYSWADGLRGKPGYVYQASNWLYGGSIWIDAEEGSRESRELPMLKGPVRFRSSAPLFNTTEVA